MSDKTILATTMRKFINRKNEKTAYIIRDDAANTKLAIFVHGFIGNYLKTWGQLPQMLKDHADEDLPPYRDTFGEWDYCFVGYSTRQVQGYLDISDRVLTIWNMASRGVGVFARPYSRFALFGHSLGTLGIRQFLCATSKHPIGMPGALQGTALFGTPLVGSWLARLGSIVFPVADALVVNNPQMQMLKVWNECSWAHTQWPEVEVVLGQGDMVVGDAARQFVHWHGDRNPEMVTVLDHSDLVKTREWGSSVVVDVIQSILR